MTISNASRLWLYIGMAVTPVWIDFFKLSTDYSLRGLAMPFLTSVNAAIVVMLARTRSKDSNEPPTPPTQ